METITVELGERSYPICIGVDMLREVGERLRAFRFSGIAVVTNPTVQGLYGPPVIESLRESYPDVSLITIPDGEGYKDLLWLYYLYGELLKQRLDRASALVALGGGVIGDITGFVASTYMRGIPFIQVPTTLLAQVDSSVGGKTGVNHSLGKNMIGTFHQPGLVWTDVSTLRTLPRREFLAGIAEVVKYGVIRDGDLFTFLEDNAAKILNHDVHALERLIKRSCEIKADVVSRDEREKGLRAILNYGHTIGHAIETATGYTRLLHGEAVAIGMYSEAKLSVHLGYLKEEEAERIRALLTAFGLPTAMPPGLDEDRFLSSLRLDKKAVSGEVRCVLPVKIGAVRIEPLADTAGISTFVRALP